MDTEKVLEMDNKLEHNQWKTGYCKPEGIVTIVAVYGPNEDLRDEEKKQVFDKLNDTIDSNGKPHEIFLMGNFKAQTEDKIMTV